jgi:hypothetical protein
MFFVNNASRIATFVNTVIDSVAEVVKGNVGAVVNKINDVLGQMVPIIIGFLASLIGLGGIGQKIREIVTKLQKPVNQALDFVIKKGLQLAAPVIRGLKGIGAKAKATVAAGKAWVKGKAAAAASWTKEKAQAGLDLVRSAILRKLGRKRAVPMLGKTHHLFVEKRGGAYRVMFASTAGELIARIRDAEANSPNVKASSILQRRLRKAREEVERADGRLKDALDSNDMKQIQAAEGSLIETVDRVEARMIELGREFDVDRLSGGKYVLDGKVHPDYQGKVRVTFYGPASAYSKHAQKKLDDAFAAKAGKVPNPLAHPDKFWCPGVPSKNLYPHLAAVSDKYALDHKVGVATHWKSGAPGSTAGNNSKQPNRVNWYGDPNNLEILCRDCNSAKQSGGDHFDPDVGADFAGPNGMR